MSMTQMTWLVTGCSSGFGEQFVYDILARGDRVIATGRQASSRLTHLKDTGASILDLDVTLSQTELDKKVAEALAIYGTIDVLVNNAGYIVSGAFEEQTHESLTKQLNTNLFGALNLTRSLLPHFRANKAGTLVYIGSEAGWQGEASASAYCISKFALAGAAECLQKELSMFGIRTIIFEPGYYRTKAFGNIIHHTPDSIPDYSDFNKAVREFEKTSYGKEPGDPKKAVERMIDVVKGEGLAKGRDLPVRMPLGSDGLKFVEDQCMATLKICEKWRDLITSTDIE